MSVCENILGTQWVWKEQGKEHKEKEMIPVKNSGGWQRVLNRTPGARRPFEENLTLWSQWPECNTIVLRLAPRTYQKWFAVVLATKRHAFSLTS